MDHISFGTSSPLPSSPSIGGSSSTTKSFSSPNPKRPSALGQSSRINERKAPWKRVDTEIKIPDQTNTVLSLIQNMKPSFLPKDVQEGKNLSIVAFSEPSHKNPLFLGFYDDAAILIGSGFGTLEKAWKTYQTFPDIRLIFSLKEHIRALVLTDESIDVQTLFSILPVIDFPLIYAPRDIIANIRNNKEYPDTLEKCRFFEIFPDGLSSRRISEFEIRYTLKGGTPILSLCAWNASFNFESSLGISPSLLGAFSSENILTTSSVYTFGDVSFEMGEILLIANTGVKKHQFRFTFDTFFLDAKSAGVVAGYTLGDRLLLSENGVLTFALEEDARLKTIRGHIFIDSRGFVHAHEVMTIHKEILKWIRKSYESLVLANPSIDRAELVAWLRREITKYCFLLTGRTPVVMPMIIDAK
jgi:hypothetical protein